jgi:site-specific recombinase XerD
MILDTARLFLRWAVATHRLPADRTEGLPSRPVSRPEPPSEGPWGQWQADYLRALRSRGLAGATLRIRTVWLRRLERWSRSAGVIDPAALTHHHVSGFLHSVTSPQPHLGRPWAPSSQGQAQVSVRLFLRWAVKTGRLLVDPTSDTQLQRIPPATVHVPTVDQVHALLAPMPSETRYQFRNRVVLELLYSTALRRSEAVALDLTDVNLRDGWLRVRRGKGGVARLMPIESHLADLLERYVTDCRPAFCPKPEQAALFLSHHGRRLHPLSVRDLVRKAGQRVGLPGLRPHDLRRACATHLLQAGAPLEAVRQQLGHRGLQTVDRYAQLTPENVCDEHARTHPRGSA